MSNCPQCGIDRKSLSTPCLVCGFGSSAINALSEPIAKEPDTKRCTFCGETIQDIAIKCKHCGEFIAADSASSRTNGKKAQTIELTSKELKLQIMLSSLLTIGSLLLMSHGCIRHMSGYETNAGIWALGFLAGLIWFCAVRFKIWWHHGWATLHLMWQLYESPTRPANARRHR